MVMVIGVAMVAVEELVVALLYIMQQTNSQGHFCPVVVMESVNMGQLVQHSLHKE